MNPKLLQQLALAKQAGTQSMAKDFFAKTPSPGQDAGADGEPKPGGEAQTSAAGGDTDMKAGPTNDDAGAGGGGAGAGGDQMTPEQLQELLQLLEQQGGQGGGQG